MNEQLLNQAPPRRNVFLRFFGWIWKLLDVFRRAVHLFLMLLVFGVLMAMFSSGAPKIPSSAALVLAPSGQIVEQLSGDPLQQALDELSDSPQLETSIRDLIDVIDAAIDDTRIQAIALDLDELSGAGMSNLRSLGQRLEQFRGTGRKVIAYGDFFLQPQYYIAAHADEVYLHPSGAVFLQGYGRYRMYMREALEKLKVDSHVFTVGEYKSFLEPYTRDDMSPEDKESSIEWLDGLWQQYRSDVRAARGFEEGLLESYVEDFVTRLEQNDGNLARLALEAGLVDELRTRDQVRTRLTNLVGVDPGSKSFRQVSHSRYLAPIRSTPEINFGDAVGVIVAKGDILDGEQPPGTIGGDTVAALLRKARLNDSIKAVVLRIDSGGGSKFASEIIQREVQLLRDAGKPVVASMGAVAASGGYFIAMDANEIWASPTTITGSIGIGAHLPTFQNSLDALGLHVDGVGTTQFSGQFRPDRDLNEAAQEVLQLSIEYGYRDFITQVARARGMTVEEVDRIARGRVWIGSKALELNLVDKLGNLQDAIASAARLGGLGDDYDVRYVEKELSFRETVAMQLAGQARSVAGRTRQQGAVSRLVREIDRELTRFASLNDPQNLYFFCFCDLR